MKEKVRGIRYRVFSLFIVSMIFTLIPSASRLAFSGGALTINVSFVLFYFFASLIIGWACFYISHGITRLKFHQHYINIIVPSLVSSIVVLLSLLFLGGDLITSIICVIYVFFIYFGNKYINKIVYVCVLDIRHKNMKTRVIK
jgi:hypothetical protein